MRQWKNWKPRNDSATEKPEAKSSKARSQNATLTSRKNEKNREEEIPTEVISTKDQDKKTIRNDHVVDQPVDSQAIKDRFRKSKSNETPKSSAYTRPTALNKFKNLEKASEEEKITQRKNRLTRNNHVGRETLGKSVSNQLKVPQPSELQSSSVSSVESTGKDMDNSDHEMPKKHDRLSSGKPRRDDEEEDEERRQSIEEEQRSEKQQARTPTEERQSFRREKEEEDHDDEEAEEEEDEDEEVEDEEVEEVKPLRKSEEKKVIKGDVKNSRMDRQDSLGRYRSGEKESKSPLSPVDSENRRPSRSSVDKKWLLSNLYQGNQATAKRSFDSDDSLENRKTDVASQGQSTESQSTDEQGKVDNRAHVQAKVEEAPSKTTAEVEAKEQAGDEKSVEDEKLEQARVNMLREQEERLRQEEMRKEEERKRKEEEERKRKEEEEARRMQEIEWERSVTSKRTLVINDLDFTDLRDEDDKDVFEIRHAHHDAQGPPPPPPVAGGVPPPPPPVPGGPPPPPPPPSGGAPPPPPPVAAPPSDLDKRKFVRLFWKEVKNSPLINGVNKTIWGSIDPVDIDTKKLAHLFETKNMSKTKVWWHY